MSADNLSNELYRAGYTDGLPIISPTPERVALAVACVPRDPQDVVAVIPPAMGIATVEKVAVNAVMAGCRPEHLPVVVAAVEAFAQPEFNGRALQDTGNPAAPLILINGPIRTEISLAVAENCMGSGAQANLVIGRAVRFVLRNIGAQPGVAPKVTQGYPGRISFCFGENEEESPWDPLHVERGLSLDRSAVTVIAAQGTSNILVSGQPEAKDILTMLAAGMINPGANNFVFVAGEPLLVLNPGQAQILSAAGVTKAGLKAHLFQHARVPLDLYPERTREIASLEERAVDGSIPITTSADRIMVVVAGASGWHSTFVPTYGESLAVTREIELVA
jgi:hypothetical protein